MSYAPTIAGMKFHWSVARYTRFFRTQTEKAMVTCELSMKAAKITFLTQVVFPQSQFRRLYKGRFRQRLRRSQGVENLLGFASDSSSA